MAWQPRNVRALFHGLGRFPAGWFIPAVLTVVACSTACPLVAEAADGASGGIPALERITRDDVVATLSTNRRVRYKLLMLPIGRNPGVLLEAGREARSFSLVRPGKAHARLWWGQHHQARLSCAADNSGFILAKYSYDKHYRVVKRTLAKVFDASGKEIASYTTKSDCRLGAALSAGRGWFARKNRDGTDVFFLYDRTGTLVSQAGPFKDKDIAWTHDGKRLLVNVGDQLGGMDGGSGYTGNSTKILIVDMAEGKVLYELPPAYRGQLSPWGRFVVTAGEGKLRFWKGQKEIRVFDLKTPATLAVFSPDGRTVAFGVGRAVHVYRTDDWMRTMAVEPPEADQSFGISSASLSNTGRLMMVSYIAKQGEQNRSNLLCLYDSDGTRLWLGRYPWKDGRPTVPGISKLTPDGNEVYIRVGDKLVRVTIPDK